MDGSGVKIAPLICFEDSVPEVVRRAAGQLPHLLVNLTNDAWFGKSAGAKQHLENARFRAIETRLPLLRAKEFIGKMLTVRFQELTDDGLPRFPVGIEFRDYE